MHFVAALDSVEGLRPVLGLFEGVVTGAAVGYARMAGKPASTLLHVGPGLANGLANLHNARRASSPIVNIVGDHATSHARYDAPLSSDIKGFARPVSDWIQSSTSARTVGADAARAVQASMGAAGRVATLILPADTAWEEADGIAAPLPKSLPVPVAGDTVERIARLMRRGLKTVRAHARRGSPAKGAACCREDCGENRCTPDVRHVRTEAATGRGPGHWRTASVLCRAGRRAPGGYRTDRAGRRSIPTPTNRAG
ncbi:hypothetical protein R70199_07376 [Paraburkholderia domus]|nr:hypothetical protein R70199_07376 [Paraburkholderia domus]